MSLFDEHALGRFRIYLSGGSSLPTVHTGDRLHSERPHSHGEERPGQYLQSGYPADSQTLSWNHHRDNNAVDWRAHNIIIKSVDYFHELTSL